MAFDVLEVFRLLAVYVAGQVEVELVLLDLIAGNHPRVFWNFEPPVEYVYDLVEVLGAQAVLGAVFHETLAGVDHENALAGVSVLLINDNNTSRNAGAVE